MPVTRFMLSPSTRPLVTSSSTATAGAHPPADRSRNCHPYLNRCGCTSHRCSKERTRESHSHEASLFVSTTAHIYRRLSPSGVSREKGPYLVCESIPERKVMIARNLVLRSDANGVTAGMVAGNPSNVVAALNAVGDGGRSSACKRSC